MLTTPTLSKMLLRIKGILDAKYEPADLHKVCSSLDHLTSDEQAKLEVLLSKYETLFDGSLGHWIDTEYDIELLKTGCKTIPHLLFPYSQGTLRAVTIGAGINRSL